MDPCDLCSLPETLCVCASTPRIACATRLVLLVDHRELKKPTNTGGLAARALEGSEVHVSGAREAPVDYARVAPPDATNLLLFPSDGAVPLTSAFPGPRRLIVPDGDWGQASRLRRKLPPTAPLIPVALPPGPPSRYGLRRAPRTQAEGLATLEAIARAMTVLEGEDVGRALEALFERFVARHRRYRGLQPTSSAYVVVPS